MDEIVFDDGFKEPTSGEVVFDDKISGGDSENVSSSMPTSEEMTRISADKSEINTMYDGFGNKTETRCFNNHPRLQCVMLRTSVEGKRQVFVYGQNGDVKDLPEEMLDKTTTASADELANAAGLFEVRGTINLPTIVSSKPQNLPPLQPMPSSKFQIQKQEPVEAEAAPQNEQATDNTSDGKIEQNTSQNEAKREAVTENRRPNEQNEN